jgi:16S rRNA G966 N2-methylase RsmD
MNKSVSRVKPGQNPQRHIDHVIVPKTHSPLYMIHKYWARKPENVVRAYIETYSNPGDLVLDPFVGSGVTALEAVAAGRKAIAIDLNPMATFITRGSAMPCDLEDLDREFLRIERDVRRQIEELYKTKCPSHSQETAMVRCGIWDKERLEQIWVDCADDGTVLASARAEDRKLVGDIAKRQLREWAPSFVFPPGVVFDQAIREAGDKLSDLFTPRAWHALAILREAISKAKNEATRSLLLLTFTSMLGQVSRMVPQREGAKLSGNVGWTVHSYWAPAKSREFNVWHSFVNRFRRTMAAKEQSQRYLDVRFGETFDELRRGKANLLLLTRSALDLSNVVPDNSVDYVFTDPPYGGSIPYMELSTLWAQWAAGSKSDLFFASDLSDEITVDPKYQKKDFGYYHLMLRNVFRQVYGCLKPGRYATVTFHNPEIKVWNSIVQAIAEAGFSLDKILYQPPPRASIGGLSRPYGSAIGDYYLRLQKARVAQTPDLPESERLFERIVVETAKHIIAERGEPTPYTFILNGIVPALKQAGVLLAGKKGWDQVLKENIGAEFTLAKVLEDGKVVGHNWALAHPEQIPYLDVVPLSERVERAVLDLLTREIKTSFDEVLQEVFTKFPNAMTPTSKSVNDVLRAIAERTADGKWRLRPEVRTRESQHAMMVRYISELGLSAGLKVYAAPPAPSVRGVLTTLPKKLAVENRTRVAMIDVLWIKDDRVTHAFEVENTTGFIAAIARGSNLHAAAKRFMVMPEERVEDLQRKLSDPSVARDYEYFGWQRIFYNRLEDYYERPKSMAAKVATTLSAIVEKPMFAKFGVPSVRRPGRAQRVPAGQLRMGGDD